MAADDGRGELRAEDLIHALHDADTFVDADGNRIVVDPRRVYAEERRLAESP